MGSWARFNGRGTWTVYHVMWKPGQGTEPVGSTNTSKLMKEIHTSVHHPRPPRPVRILANRIATTILRSPWHSMRSNQLLLLTFTGRKSGKEFTTPLRYVQEGETLRLIVVYPWWRNLLGEPTVRVLLRGHMHTGTAEVLPEEDGEVVVKVHLNR
ncbi:MAG: nitroreductase/quinone reductase family protein [Chloroflexota bacterium]|nr:nitroreductase/quinone reductase family protein [Chloroflexota bacterium]